MSDSPEEDDQKKAESTSRMWVEPQAGPSSCEPSRQGYCGTCRVLYRHLDQHLSSLRHLDSVRVSSRGSGSTSTASSRNKLTLMERFLQDVLQHHPHRYSDPRSPHADLPLVSAAPLQKAALEECPPSSDDVGGVREEQVSPPAGGQTPPTQAQPPLHRKAHRKTNRRKSSSSSSPSPHRGSGPGPPTELKPWRRWQKERREVLKEEAFSSDLDLLDQTIEEVIQMHCHSNQQEETESFHFSLPISMETQSDDWDSPVQPSHTPVETRRAGGRSLNHLMEVQVPLEDQVYTNQLHSALHRQLQEGGGARQDHSFLTRPIEEVLPAPACIPESFRGKSWAQIEQEDEQKVDKLVRQFRGGKFICYFDTESLARYGRRSRNKKWCGQDKEAEPVSDLLPLVDRDDDDSARVRRRRRRGRVASRCQVVKVSHSTQTVRLVVPAVRQPALKDPPTSIPAANQDAAERTPAAHTWRCLPPSYSNIITPLQPRTSVVYLLCPPSSPAHTCTPASDSAHKRCRRKRRPVDLQGLKVKYKRLPVRFYDPGTNRITKNPPRDFLSPPPSCVRQLFRSLSPDLNTDRTPEEGEGSSRVKGQKSPGRFLLGTLSRDKQDTARKRGRTAQAPPPPQKGRGRGRERTRPPPSKRRTRAQATHPPPRREGLRRTAPPPASARKGRGRRGRR